MELKIVKNVLGSNNEIAAELHTLLGGKKITCMNLMSGPGSGKTTILEKTIPHLQKEHGISCAVIEGDVEGDDDGVRLDRLGVPVVQLNTQGACHLSAPMIKNGMEGIALETIDFLIIENVGNLVCPAGFYLGEDFKVTVVSLPEGDDKPAKYPNMFKKSRVVLINKIDLAPLLTFSTERIHKDCRRLNPELNVMEISAQEGTGIAEWCDFLATEIRRKKEGA